MAIGRISGPMLEQNLTRLGVDLAFETDLLYLDVTNTRIGVNTALPDYTLDVNGTIRSTDLSVTNQSDLGDITILGNTISSTSSTINLVPTGINSVVYNYRVNVGTSLELENNTIRSINPNQDINLSPNGSGIVNITGDAYVGGNLHVTGSVTIDGDIQFGNSDIDSIIFVADINSDIIPDLDNTYQLGTTLKRWSDIWVYNVNATTIISTNIQVDTADITTTATVTGNLNVSGVTTLTSTITGHIIPTTNNTYDLGSVSNYWKDLYVGQAQIDSIQINDNYIQTTTLDTNLELRPNGTGSILLEDFSVKNNEISTTGVDQDFILTPNGTGLLRINSNKSIVVPIGTDAERPAVPETGMIRFNTDVNYFEGFDGSYWAPLGGIYSLDRNTYITPELTPGFGDSIIRFYTNNVVAATLSATEFVVNSLQVDDINVDNNIISTTTTDTDLVLSPNGTGAVVIDNLKFADNKITNTVNGSNTELYTTGTGYWKINGTNGVVIPSGVSAQRPGVPQIGLMRYNTEDGLTEIWDGFAWVSVAGSVSGINAIQAAEIALERVLIFG